MSKPVEIVITGRIASGKSETLAAFARHGVSTISSDRIVHDLLKKADPKQSITGHFGEGILTGGEIDRSALAKIVFNNRPALDWLEKLLHPRVRDEYLVWRDKLSSSTRLCAIEIPLLYETGGEKYFDYVCLVTAPRAIRQKRSKSRIEQRDYRFIDDKEKIPRADYTYANTGSLKQLDDFVEAVLKDLQSVITSTPRSRAGKL